MPNWCINEVKISGSKDEIKAFVEKAKGKDSIFSLNSFIPMPDEKDWYQWCCKNWGTKWDVADAAIMEAENAVYYFFDTAWTPPIVALKKISEMYPNLRFDVLYFEPQMEFLGVITFIGGKEDEKVYVEGNDMLDWLKAERPDLWEEWKTFYGKEDDDE